MEAFFSRVVYKPTAEWKEEVVMLDPAPAPALEAVFPDGTKVTIPSDTDPRRVFADWLMTEGNPYFARSIANRAWSWLLGRGVVHEPDDIRDDNPPANPALLACLERELIAADYDLKASPPSHPELPHVPGLADPEERPPERPKPCSRTTRSGASTPRS